MTCGVLVSVPVKGYPCTLTYSCEACGCSKLSIFWKVKDEADALRKYMCHDGFGYQFEDAFFCCSNCGKKWSYDEG
jgi:hypothetical protein